MSGEKGRKIYNWLERVTVAGAGDVTLSGFPVPEGGIVQIDEFLVCDETTANKAISLGLVRQGVTHWLKIALAGGSTYGLILERPILLFEGEKPTIKVASAGASDVINVVCRGFYLC